MFIVLTIHRDSELNSDSPGFPIPKSIEHVAVLLSCKPRYRSIYFSQLILRTYFYLFIVKGFVLVGSASESGYCHVLYVRVLSIHSFWSMWVFRLLPRLVSQDNTNNIWVVISMSVYLANSLPALLVPCISDSLGGSGKTRETYC